MTRPIPRVVLALSVLVGIALTFAGARAAQQTDELTGLYAVADESDGNIGALFEITSMASCRRTALPTTMSTAMAAAAVYR